MFTMCKSELSHVIVLVLSVHNCVLLFYHSSPPLSVIMTQLTQDEIVSSTKTVISGLESLKVEHHAGLQALESSLKAVSEESNGDVPLISEKSEILHKSMEMIDIGIEEAKVQKSK